MEPGNRVSGYFDDEESAAAPRPGPPEFIVLDVPPTPPEGLPDRPPDPRCGHCADPMPAGADVSLTLGFSRFDLCARCFVALRNGAVRAAIAIGERARARNGPRKRRRRGAR